jgi:hypothetical protein
MAKLNWEVEETFCAFPTLNGTNDKGESLPEKWIP